MNMKKLLTTICILFLSTNAFASEAKVKEFIEGTIQNVIDSANNKKLKDQERIDNVVAIIDESIDSNWISRFVLGINYRKASKEHRDKFSTLYRKFMINTYGPKFKKYNGKKVVVKEVNKRKRYYLVKTDFYTNDSPDPVFIDYRVKESNGKLVILDFIAEGISLIETQRSEFNSAIAKVGMEQFLKDLEERVNELKNSTKS